VAEVTTIYLCPHHLVPRSEGGICPDDCTLDMIECHPGEDGDPLRKPLLDAEGNVVTRAPLWWLRVTISELYPHLEEK